MKKRRLWLEPGDPVLSKPTEEGRSDTYDAIFERFSSSPSRKSLRLLVFDSLVVGQEFVLTCLLLACHRAALSVEAKTEESTKINEIRQYELNRLLKSIVFVWLSFLLMIFHNESSYSRKSKVRHRLSDGIFMAIFLRFLAAVLKTLTASYSSDTVHALAISSLFLHLLACDYSYANGLCGDTASDGDSKRRPTFQGGTMSLTAAFFATILLASRLESNGAVYIFICFSMTLFALYPAGRHQVAINTKESNRWVPLVITILLTLATLILLEPLEIVTVVITLVLLCVLVPFWNFLLQSSKISLRGPWDIAHV